MSQDCFSSGWVELFGLSCCGLPFARCLDEFVFVCVSGIKGATAVVCKVAGNGAKFETLN